MNDKNGRNSQTNNKHCSQHWNDNNHLLLHNIDQKILVGNC